MHDLDVCSSAKTEKEELFPSTVTVPEEDSVVFTQQKESSGKCLLCISIKQHIICTLR